MARRQKRPTKKDREAEGRAVLQGLPKMSETMLEFARPLLDQLPSPPPIELVRQVMTIATVAWNLPIHEQRNSPVAKSFRASYDAAMVQMPPEIGTILSGLMYARLTTYAKDPRLAFVEVTDGGGGEAQIVATAMLANAEK